VVREPRVPRRGAIDDGAAGRGGERRARHLVVDAPARVVVEGLAALRPPRVRALALPHHGSVDVHEADLAEPSLEVGDLPVEDPGHAVVVAAPVPDVQRTAHDVEVAGQQHVPAGRSQFGQARIDEIEVGVLQLHARGVRRARVQVGGHERERAGRGVEVGLHPTARVHVRLLAGQARAHGHGRHPARDGDPRPPLEPGHLRRHVPGRPEQVRDDRGVRPGLLQQQEVGGA